MTYAKIKRTYTPPDNRYRTANENATSALSNSETRVKTTIWNTLGRWLYTPDKNRSRVPYR